MKSINFRVPLLPGEAFHFQIDDSAYLYPHLHEHAELQITWIQQGTGTVIAGNYSGRFVPGDVFIIGSHQPHVFRNDPCYFDESENLRVRAVSIYIGYNAFLERFGDWHDMAAVRAFLNAAGKGFQLEGEIRNNVAIILAQLEVVSGIDRILLFLNLMKLFTIHAPLQPLSSVECNSNDNLHSKCRLDHVTEFTEKQYVRAIKLSEVATVSNLTVSAFCKFFKIRTGKTYIDYLNEVRVRKAGELLLDENRTISCICYECGFNSLSNFNRSFKKVNHITPMQWKQERMSISWRNG